MKLILIYSAYNNYACLYNANSEFETRELFTYFHVETKEVRILTIHPDVMTVCRINTLTVGYVLLWIQHAGATGCNAPLV